MQVGNFLSEEKVDLLMRECKSLKSENANLKGTVKTYDAVWVSVISGGNGNASTCKCQRIILQIAWATNYGEIF